jgi:hypothetical protein
VLRARLGTFRLLNSGYKAVAMGLPLLVRRIVILFGLIACGLPCNLVVVVVAV